MNIEYRLEGQQDAPLLVLSNSLGTTLEMWQPQMAAFSGHFQVLRYNARGHGNTPLPDDVLSLETLGHDVITLLDALNIDSAHFCGISMGGLTGLWLARYHPERVKKLVVANTAARIGHSETWHQRAQDVRVTGLSSVAASASARWFTEEYIRHQQPQVSRLVMQLAHGNPAGYAACCDALAVSDLQGEVPRITRPALVIGGKFDTVTSVAEAQWLQRHIPQAQLAVLPAAHLSNIACPQAFNDSVILFLQS